MTVGIYILKFAGTDKVYVGQSVNIEKRFDNHKRRLKAGTHNYKMQKAFKQYGMPVLEVICECSKEELNSTELEAFSIYNAIENGYNIAEEPDIHQEGEKNGSSKYSNELIEEVFEYLRTTELKYKEIAEITGVADSTVRHVANGEAHTWLSRKFPKQYEEMRSYATLRRSNTNNAASKGILYPPVISPEGVVYNIENANAFARSKGMDPSYFIKLLNGKALTCKGWKVHK